MIGNLRTKIAVFIPQTSPDDMGGLVVTWSFYAHIWAHVQTKSSQDRLENGRLAVTTNYLVTTRWQRGFPERCRLQWGEHKLRLLSASDPDLRHERLHLICEEEEQ